MRKIFAFTVIIILLSVFVLKADDLLNLMDNFEKGFSYEYVLKKFEKMPNIKILKKKKNLIEIFNQTKKDEPKLEKYLFNSKGIFCGGFFINWKEKVSRKDFDERVKDLIEPESPDGFIKIFDEKLLLYSDENSYYIYAYVKGSNTNFIAGIIYDDFDKREENVILYPQFIDDSCPELYVYMKKTVMKFLKREEKNGKQKSKNQ